MATVVNGIPIGRLVYRKVMVDGVRTLLGRCALYLEKVHTLLSRPCRILRSVLRIWRIAHNVYYVKYSLYAKSANGETGVNRTLKAKEPST